MPRIVPLYPKRPLTAIERVEPLDLTPGACTRCRLHERQKLYHNCMPAVTYEGNGGLLILGEYPGPTEDQVGQPFQGKSGQFLRALVGKYWGKRPCTFDSAVRCCPGNDQEYRGQLADVIEACRPYLAAVISEVKPDRILAMGPRAVQAITGRALSLMSVRRGYCWIRSGDKAIPVFYFLNPANGASNRFLAHWIREDFAWAVSHAPPFEPAWESVARVVLTEDDALQAEQEMLSAPWFAYDVETSGVMWRKFQVLCAGLVSAGARDAWVWEQEAMRSPACLSVLQRLLKTTKAKKVGSNIKYDQNASTLALSVPVRGVISDTRLLRRLMDPEAAGDLETMAELVGMGGHKEEAHLALVEAQKKVRSFVRSRDAGLGTAFVAVEDTDIAPEVIKDFRKGDEVNSYAYGLLPREVRARYVARDALSTARVEEVLEARLNGGDVNLARVYHNIVVPAARAIQQVEAWGVCADREALQNFHSYLSSKRDAVLVRLRKHAGDENFNPGSVKQVADLLYRRMKFPVQKETLSGSASTDEEAIQLLRRVHEHEVLDDLLAYRSVSKLDGTYAFGMLKHIRDDGRIHPSILLDGAKSGRTSCSDPNLQNIPRDADSPEGKMARDVFIAPPGYVLISADYSQIELRVAAMLSGDGEMQQIFRDRVDFHRRTAEWIAKVAWGIAPEQVEKKHRSAAKSVNFGLLYGLGDDGLAAQIGCTIAEAQKVRSAVLGRFRRLDRWIKECLVEAKKTGYCRTWWDGAPARRRSLWRLASLDREECSHSERAAHNTPVQGTASEFCLASLVSVVQWILREGVPAKLILPIHDALLLEVREDCVDEVVENVRSIMIGWNSGAVPLEVDVDVGPAWGSLTKFAFSNLRPSETA